MDRVTTDLLAVFCWLGFLAWMAVVAMGPGAFVAPVVWGPTAILGAPLWVIAFAVQRKGAGDG